MDVFELYSEGSVGVVAVGWTNDQAQAVAEMARKGFVRHVDFLGATGSGKTTAVLNLIEQLLLQDIPVLLVDRKGDLVSYALDEVWERRLQSPGLSRRQQLLKDKVDVAVYTPRHLRRTRRPEDGRVLFGTARKSDADTERMLSG